MSAEQENVRVVARFRPLPTHDSAPAARVETTPSKADRRGRTPSRSPASRMTSPRFTSPRGRRTHSPISRPRADISYGFPEGKQSVAVNDNSTKKTAVTFNMDMVYGPATTQEQIFDEVARKTVLEVLRGYNGTILAYGQTGSGKTHTMFGYGNEAGIVPRCAQLIFQGLSDVDDVEEMTVKASFLEVYRERVQDLLFPTDAGLKIRETPQGGVYIEDLTAEYCSEPEDILALIEAGTANRIVASTDMNETSSRSHSIMVIEVSQKLRDTSMRTGKLNLADLAGSERVSKSGAEGETMKEAQTINQSLSCLGNCINALTDRKRTHIPFRDSKLTYLLKDSLGGNTKTTLLVCCSLEPVHAAETLSTLRFAKRAKRIKNTARVNKTWSLEQYAVALGKLRLLLIEKDRLLAAKGVVKRVTKDASTQTGPDSPGTSETELPDPISLPSLLPLVPPLPDLVTPVPDLVTPVPDLLPLPPNEVNVPPPLPTRDKSKRQRSQGLNADQLDNSNDPEASDADTDDEFVGLEVEEGMLEAEPNGRMCEGDIMIVPAMDEAPTIGEMTPLSDEKQFLELLRVENEQLREDKADLKTETRLLKKKLEELNNVFDKYQHFAMASSAPPNSPAEVQPPQSPKRPHLPSVRTARIVKKVVKRRGWQKHENADAVFANYLKDLNGAKSGPPRSPGDLPSGKEGVCAGFLFKKPFGFSLLSTGWRRRLFVLRGASLGWYRGKISSDVLINREDGDSAQGFFVLGADWTVRKVAFTDAEFGFIITRPSRSTEGKNVVYKLHAESELERVKWVQAISNVVQALQRQQTHQESVQAGTSPKALDYTLDTYSYKPRLPDRRQSQVTAVSARMQNREEAREAVADAVEFRLDDEGGKPILTSRPPTPAEALLSPRSIAGLVVQSEDDEDECLIVTHGHQELDFDEGDESEESLP